MAGRRGSQAQANGGRADRGRGRSRLRPWVFTVPLMLSLSPALGQSLPSDAMLSHTFNDLGPNLLLSGPLKALKVATLDLPPALGAGLGFTLAETPGAIPVSAPSEDTYSYPPPLILAPPDARTGQGPALDADADLPPIFGPPPAGGVYLELALDSLLSLPNLEEAELSADDDGPDEFGPPVAHAPTGGGIGSDALFPVAKDDQGWADLGTESEGEDGPLYRDAAVIFGTDPQQFPAQPFEHSAVSMPASLVPVPVSAPPMSRRDDLATPGRLGGPTFAERLGLEGPARARAEKCLAEAVYFESRGEAKRGQIAVAQVVLNRVFSGYYPNDVCKAVYQNAHRHLACQFTFACDNVKDVIREPDMWVQAKQISADMLDGKLWLESVGRATHYHAYWVHPSWVREMRKLDRIGVHTFYRPKRWNS